MDMGTSGVMAFVLDGETKAGYVHFDAYPEHLGAEILVWLRQSWQRYEVYALVRSLKVVDDSTTPTPEQIEALKQYANTNVSSHQLDEWYVLLRETQGDPDATLKAGYVYGDHKVEPYRLGYFGEYMYVVDFDTKTFTATGYGHELGRWSFAELPTREAFIDATTNNEDED
jgi:hypothetical protein